MIPNLQLQRDIARRYHIEQELRQSQTRTHLIINAIRDCAIYMLDVEGRIASWNPGAQALNAIRLFCREVLPALRLGA